MLVLSRDLICEVLFTFLKKHQNKDRSRCVVISKTILIINIDSSQIHSHHYSKYTVNTEREVTGFFSERAKEVIGSNYYENIFNPNATSVNRKNVL